jgi:hypothetical protein
MNPSSTHLSASDLYELRFDPLFNPGRGFSGGIVRAAAALAGRIDR